jgi:hypothetical protein
MKLPGESSSSEVLINYSTYTSVRVDANPETSHLAAPVKESYEALETKVADRKKKTKESASKLAIRDEKEDNLDALILKLSLELLSVTGNNRENVRYKSLFSKTPSSISKQSAKDKLSEAKIIIQKLNNNSSDEIYAKHLPLLQTGISECEEADKNYQTALENEKSCFDFEKLAQTALRNVLVKTYGKLIDIKGKKDADKYFKKSGNGKKKDNKENTQPEESIKK